MTDVKGFKPPARRRPATTKPLSEGVKRILFSQSDCLGVAISDPLRDAKTGHGL